MAGYVAISGLLSQTPQGTIRIGPLSITPNGSNDFQSSQQTLPSGNNSITVPSWAVGVLIQPPTGNAVVITLKGVNGDTGTVISPSGPTLISLTAGSVSTFVLNAASTISALTSLTFF